MEQRFARKTVVVTGASSGIGVGIARRFAGEGANVVLAARRKMHWTPSRTISAWTGPSQSSPTSLNKTACRPWWRPVLPGSGASTSWSRTPALGLSKALEETTLRDWRLLMNTDVDSCFFGAQAALPHLKRSGGNIVQIASASGLGGDRNLSASNAAKGAVVNFTRGLAFDLGRHGIRVNAVAPALTFGEDRMNLPGVAEMIEAFNGRRAVTGYGTPADVAAAVAFLASPDARFITGTILPVDGGITAGSGQPAVF